MSDSAEIYHAEMEAARNEAEEAYFKFRPQADLLMNRQLFRAGYERGFQELWDKKSMATGETAGVRVTAVPDIPEGGANPRGCDRPRGSFQQAFPSPADERWPAEGGLTKREWYAGLAMQGLCANPAWFEANRQTICTEAVGIADCILATLETNKGQP